MARKLAIAVMAEMDAGTNPADEARASRSGLSLGEVFELYKANRISQKKRTVASMQWMWERYLGKLPEEEKKPHGQQRTKAPGGVDWSRRGLVEISHADVSRLRLALNESVGSTTANRVLELLRAIYNFARKQRIYSGENPADGHDKFPLASRQRFLQAHEARPFLRALAEDPDEDFRDYVALSIFTGARRGNLLAMRWDELDLESGHWIVSGEKTKNGEPLIVPLVGEAVRVLRRRQEANGTAEWVFPGNGPGGHLGPPRKQWAALLDRAGVKDLRLHDLRRTLGSWMANTGASVVMTQRALGHKTIDASLIYQRLQLKPVRLSMQKAVAGLLAAAKDKEPLTIEARPAQGKSGI